MDEGGDFGGGERGQGWISALKVTGLGCLLPPLLISICLLTPKTASSVRGSGGVVEAEVEVKRSKGQMVSIKLVCTGGIAEGGRDLVVGRRCGRGTRLWHGG